jgi:transposase
VKTCYEAGYSGFWLHRELEAAGISNIVVHAASIAVEANNRVKTDKRDSLKMATQLAAGQLRGIRIPTVEQEQSRLLTRTREQLVQARRRAQIQIRMRLHQFGMFPIHIERIMRPSDVIDILAKLERNDLKYSIELLYLQWQFLAQKVKELDKELVKRAASDPREEIYRSVPGIGALIARILSNELGDMSQFANERALFSCTGLTPGEYSSGNNVYRGHISRQGNSRLRHMLVEAAWKAIRKDLVLREHFDRLSVRTGKKRAIVAVARKLIGRVRAAFKAHECYVVGHKKAA